MNISICMDTGVLFYFFPYNTVPQFGLTPPGQEYFAVGGSRSEVHGKAEPWIQDSEPCWKGYLYKNRIPCSCLEGHPTSQAREGVHLSSGSVSGREHLPIPRQLMSFIIYFLDREIFSPAKDGAVTGTEHWGAAGIPNARKLCCCSKRGTNPFCETLPLQLQLFIWEGFRQVRPREELPCPGSSHSVLCVQGKQDTRIMQLLTPQTFLHCFLFLFKHRRGSCNGVELKFIWHLSAWFTLRLPVSWKCKSDFYQYTEQNTGTNLSLLMG